MTEIILKSLTILIGEDNKRLHDAASLASVDHIIMEYPENFLHPSKQMEKIEEITRDLHNNGIKVVTVTHSPYILDHLNNLIRAAESDHQDDLVNLFILKTKDAFISPDKISAYEITNDGPIDLMKTHEDGHKTIEWNSFSEVSDKVMGIQWDIPIIEDKKIKEKRRDAFTLQMNTGDKIVYIAVNALKNLRRPATESNINNVLIQSGSYIQIHSDIREIPQIVSQKLSALVKMEILDFIEECPNNLSQISARNFAFFSCDRLSPRCQFPH